ncbi:MAG TPA: tripartite tricarboxylate transporter substrate-binding protein [Xanthobacteraceae bacterium]|nr:tripartite tricarboxylate transporter substrate-binding protein [Xanthobacteraceae bacterium]
MPRRFRAAALRAVLPGVMACALIATPCGSPARAAEDYPVRPITLIVPYPPGGGVDTMGRLIGQRLSVALGQQVIIENRGGAGGMIGTRAAVKAAPDGYTLVMTLTGLSLGPNPGYDFSKDLAPIGLIAFTPIIVVAHPSLPASSLSDVIALAKQEPGKLAAGTPPPPTMNYFAVELFKMLAGVDVSIITYKGTAPLTTDLLGGHVKLGFNTIPASIGYLAGGQLRALAVAGATRAAALPEIPTAAEAGLPGFEAGFYYGMSAPAGTPRPIIERLNKELRLAIASEDMHKRLVDEGTDPTPSTPEEYAANLVREEAKWAALIKKLGLKFE